MDQMTERRDLEDGEPPFSGAGIAPPLASLPAEADNSHDAGQRLFESHLATIQRQIAAVARQYRMSADEAEEFAAVVHLRLIVDDYAVLRKFRGRCSLRTFLTVVIQRMCLDFRDAQWGKWRPSAAARRHGEVAIMLERLTMRDGLTFDEACTVLAVNRGVTLDKDTLARIFCEFRTRTRVRLSASDQLCEIAAADGSADRAVIEAEETAAVRRAMSVLAEQMAALSSRDRLLLQMRFTDDLSVATIARLLRVDQKWLYRRYARLFARLRKQLESHGVGGAEVVPLLGQTGE